MRILLLALLAPLAASAQPTVPRWNLVETAPVARGRFDDVKFVTPDDGWIVSTDGRIWHTGNGGASWDLQIESHEDRFRSVAFSSAEIGFAGTVLGTGADPAVLFETRDGGVTWTDATWRIIGPRPAGICGLWAVDEFNIYGVGAFHGDPVLIRTFNGGDEWYSTRLDGLAGALIDVHFVDDRVGFITGGSGSSLNGNAIVLRTADGGDSWVKVHETEREEDLTGEWGWKMSFPSESVGYVSVEYASGQGAKPAKVLKTVDGGLTWTELSIPGSTDQAGLQAIGFISEEIGWTSGRGTSSVTADGGATWQQLTHWSEFTPAGQLDGSVNRIIQVNDSLAYAIGNRVHRLSTSDTGVSTETAPALPRTFEVGPVYPNPTDGPVTLPLDLVDAARVQLTVIDLLGRVLREYPASQLGPGNHRIAWDGRDAGGRPITPGTYLLLLDVGDSKEMKQVVRIR